MQRTKILTIMTAGMFALAASPSLAFEPSGDWNDHSWSFNDSNDKQYLLNQAGEIEFFEGGGFTHNSTTYSETICESGGSGAFSGGCANDIANQNTAIGSQTTTDQSTDIDIEGDNNSAFSENTNNSDSENNGDVGADGTQIDASNNGDVNVQ